MALVDDRVSVRHRVCWVTLFSGRLTRLTRLRAAVSHGSTLRFKTTFGDDRGAKAAADEGSKTVGIMILRRHQLSCLEERKETINYKGDIRPYTSEFIPTLA